MADRAEQRLAGDEAGTVPTDDEHGFGGDHATVDTLGGDGL